jgi:hypothetical protein
MIGSAMGSTGFAGSASAPAFVFGSSGWAVVGLALVTAHPGQVRTLVAHEPPVVELLPDSAQLRASIQDVYAAWLQTCACPGSARPCPAA